VDAWLAVLFGGIVEQLVDRRGRKLLEFISSLEEHKKNIHVLYSLLK